jgi:mono/diheme cytochrome c family protein
VQPAARRRRPAMPPWRDKMSDDDVKLLWAYVRGGG